jgi:rhamnulokinase
VTRGRRSGVVAAVDLGAASGRVIVGHAAPKTLSIEEVHRFPNEPVKLPDGIHWDSLAIYREVLIGLGRASVRAPEIASVGVDSWAIDYGLLDRDGRLLGNPYAYRDPRGSRGAEIVHSRLSRAELYSRTGVQFLPFNTIYQLAASIGSAELDAAATVLLIPDLIGYWLAGVKAAETTNASTTGLLEVAASTWATDVVELVGLPRRILPDLRSAGERAGLLRPDVVEETGLRASTALTLVGSHDTASAVVGVPAADDRFAYVSCGTWALVGLELDGPILTEASRVANFTNERGVDGRIRYLRNVTGLWLLQESMRTWERSGEPQNLGALVSAAAELGVGGPLVDPDDPVFLAPGDMPTRIAAACRASDQVVPETRAELVRCILDSLAAAFARTLRDAVRLSHRDVRVVHLVGGGSQNDLLCQLTADATGLPIIAGPAEATAIGNVVVQARAIGSIDGGIETLRDLVRRTQPLRRFEPRATATEV